MARLKDLFARRVRPVTRTPRRPAALTAERLEDRTVPAPAVLDPALAVRTVVGGLAQPTSMAFLGDNDFFVLEKASGKVQHVVNGVVGTPAIDLPVNNASERGLLGIALSPNFATDHVVYLYWTQSSTGADSSNALDVPLLGNRVDRYVWNGTTLTFDRNVIQLHALQTEANNPNNPAARNANHNGGIIRFGPDGKLYVIIGDNGRRGWMQNLRNGPFGAGTPDDQFGGPVPDNAHLTGVVLRLNPDGSAPSDNPFFHQARQVADSIRGQVGDAVADQVAANLQKVYAYGDRNSFGLAFDPLSGNLWDEENGDDSFDEINRIEPGADNGWVQVMGPIDRVAQFKAIETSTNFFGLQQVRWSPANIADTPSEARRRLVNLPGSHYHDPEFSWKYAVAPAGIGFLNSRALGDQYNGDLFVGAARTFLDGGYLFKFDLTHSRKDVDVSADPRLKDKVADNPTKFDVTESESLLFGTGFGVGTDIETGPNGDLYVVSLSDGKVYEIYKKDAAATFVSTNLVSDVANPPGGAPAVVDPSLKNAWGMSFGPTTPFWVSDQRAGVTTLYTSNADGSTAAKVPLTVSIPTTPAGPQGPTGQVFNGTTDFKLPNGNPARFIFASLNGTISGWNGGTAATTVAATPGGVYTGLAVGGTAAGNFLYAANVAQGRVDVFDKDFHAVTLPGGFADPDLPAGVTTFSPFNVQNLGGTIYVTYENRADREHGGVVDAFDPNGNFLRRVVSGGVNAPWGLAIAPTDFGRFGGALLVGNFGLGDGKINAYDPATGKFLGHLTDPAGTPLAYERLWALAFGNGATGGKNVLFFTAGINAEQDGLFGSIRPLQPTVPAVPPPPGDDDGDDDHGDDGDRGGRRGPSSSGTAGGVAPWAAGRGEEAFGLFVPSGATGGPAGSAQGQDAQPTLGRQAAGSAGSSSPSTGSPGMTGSPGIRFVTPRSSHIEDFGLDSIRVD